MNNTLRHKRLNGFTLIEVMVALVIIAVALAAASRSMGITASNQAYLENKMLATWVAEDVIIQQQLQAQAGEQNFKVEMFNRTWEVELSSSPTFIPQIYKLLVQVKEPGAENFAASLATVVGPPAE